MEKRTVRTTDDIKLGLKCCIGEESTECEICPYQKERFCFTDLKRDALKIIDKGFANRKQDEAFSQPHENGGEWISVEDRLPENGVHCILCCDMKRIDGTHSQYVCDGYHAEKYKVLAGYVDDDCVTEYNEEDDEYYLKEGWYEVIKNWDDYNSIVIDDTVTHWMLLPEPPKMKGGK